MCCRGGAEASEARAEVRQCVRTSAVPVPRQHASTVHGGAAAGGGGSRALRAESTAGHTHQPPVGEFLLSSLCVYLKR